MDSIKEIIAILRGQANPQQTAPQLRGYQLYAAEARAMGETPMPYEQWVKQTTPTSASY